MLLSTILIILGVALLLWSAEKFVTGSAQIASYLGAPPLLIGIVIIGFGTSAPEIVVSVLSAYQGSPGLALGNAFGSNIANIALILGITALISPILVQSSILRKELPILTGITAITIWLVSDLDITRRDGWILIALFIAVFSFTIIEGLKSGSKELDSVPEDLPAKPSSLKAPIFWVLIGISLLIVSSRMLVHGAVNIAQIFGVSDLVIGLTIVAVGTSLPELASSVVAARKGEHDLAVGNIIGSNLFNTLAVVGLAAVVRPFSMDSIVLSRDVPVMAGLTLCLFALGYGFRGRQGRINRMEGALLTAAFIGYTTWVVLTAK